jgi:hypothetical protein
LNALDIIRLLTREGGPIENVVEKFKDRNSVTESELLQELNMFADASKRWQAALPPDGGD